jgi:insertion element IS1 protein InsB
VLLLAKNSTDPGRPTETRSIREACPACGSQRYKKNGHTRHGQQNHYCKACERQFSASADPSIIPHEQRTLIESLLRERISLRGICRAVGVSLTWLLHFMVECFAACPAHLHVQLPSDPSAVWIHQLEAEADEAWSFVEQKANKELSKIKLSQIACYTPDHHILAGEPSLE